MMHNEFNEENHTIEYKRIDKVKGKSNLDDVVRECVCFANAQGGMFFVGLDDKTKEPPSTQKISQEFINKILKSLRGFTNSACIPVKLYLCSSTSQK